MRSPDTSEEMDNAQIAWYRKLTSTERFFYTAQMMDEGKLLVASSIKSNHPDISKIDLEIETFKRIYRNDFLPEQIEEITTSMRKSLEKHFNEQKQ